MKFQGYLLGEFRNKEGQILQYLRVYVMYEAKGVVGFKCEELKCSVSLLDNVKAIKLGTDVKVLYNRYGRVDDIQQAA